MSKQALGVLVLHGFTGHLDTVNGLIPTLDRMRLPYRVPILRGHGTRYEDLVGVTWRDWYEDAEAALRQLRGEADQVVVVGLSMGGLVSLRLAMEHPEDVAGVVALAPAMRFKDPLSHLTPLLASFVTYWSSPSPFVDKEREKLNKNYPKFPVRTFMELQRLGEEVERRLAEIKAPLVLLAARHDQVVSARAPEIIYQKVSSAEKQLKWFEKSGHEMMMDNEAEVVIAEVGRQIEGIRRLAGVVR